MRVLLQVETCCGVWSVGKLDDYNAAFHAPLKVLTTTAQAGYQ